MAFTLNNIYVYVVIILNKMPLMTLHWYYMDIAETLSCLCQATADFVCECNALFQ
jgi:hypothetical protein